MADADAIFRRDTREWDKEVEDARYSKIYWRNKMTKVTDGGQAFPSPAGNGFIGMSLRDYFAAKALTGFCSNGILDSMADPTNQTIRELFWKNLATACFEIADAMIAQREKEFSK